MVVLTPTNLESFAGIPISKQKTPKSVFVGIYGMGGAGKTTTFSRIVELEDERPAALIDIDRSSDAVVHLQDLGLNIIKISKWTEALKILEAFKAGNTPFKSLIWDNISELLQLCIRHHAPTGMPEGSNAIQTWGKINASMIEFVRDIRTYCSRDEINLFMVLWEEKEKDKLTDITRIKVLLNPAFAAAFPGMATMLGRLSVPGTERSHYVRLLDFAPDEKMDTKFRVAPTAHASKIPLKLYLNGEVNFIVDFVNTVKHGKPFPAEKYKKPGSASE